MQHVASLYLSKYDQDVFPLNRNPYQLGWQGNDETKLNLHHLKQIFIAFVVGISIAILSYFSENTVTLLSCKRTERKNSTLKIRDSKIASALYALFIVAIIIILIITFGVKEKGIESNIPLNNILLFQNLDVELKTKIDLSIGIIHPSDVVNHDFFSTFQLNENGFYECNRLVLSSMRVHDIGDKFNDRPLSMITTFHHDQIILCKFWTNYCYITNNKAISFSVVIKIATVYNFVIIFVPAAIYQCDLHGIYSFPNIKISSSCHSQSQ